MERHEIAIIKTEDPIEFQSQYRHLQCLGFSRFRETQYVATRNRLYLIVEMIRFDPKEEDL